MSREADKGFIYIMSNPSFQEGLLKIGKSSKRPVLSRRKELQTTGVPEPFVVEYSAFVDDFSLIEQRAHKVLDRFRNKSNREFFNIPLPTAIIAIRDLIDSDKSVEELSGKAKMALNPTGELITRYGNGNLKTVERYREEGKSITSEEYFDNGQMKRRTNFYEGRENGMRKEWKSDGSPKKRGHMFNGHKQGKWYYYSESGVETKYFDEDKPVLNWETYDNDGELVIKNHGEASENYDEKIFTGKKKD
jgi:hypothetical protein